MASGVPYARFMATRRFASLDGLRAISIVAVIWHHAASESFPDWVPWVHAGNRGVNLFFAISAFLITTLLLRAKHRGTLQIPRFWVRPALRIFPLYYLVLLVYVASAAWHEHDPIARAGFFQHLPWFLTFTSNWFVTLDSPRVLFYFAWSLAAEEQFYLCWPWVERWFAGIVPSVAALVLLIASQGAGFALDRGVHFLALTVVASVPAAILCGVLLAHGMSSPRGFAVAWWIVGRRGAAIGGVALALGVLAFERSLGRIGEIAIGLSFAAVVGACVIREDNDLAPVLRCRPVAWIGVVSYGVYLMHMLCVGVARQLLHRLHVDSTAVLFVTGGVSSILLASLSFVTYERFFLELKERCFGERTPVPVAATAPLIGSPVPYSQVAR